MVELEVLEEYTKGFQERDSIRTSPVNRINNSSGAAGRPNEGCEGGSPSDEVSPAQFYHRIPTSSSDMGTVHHLPGDLERKYQKIMAKIPANLHIYVP